MMLGYKIDIHLMPNLPGSSPELDAAMFDEVLSDPNLQVDQWKIYPTEITPWTVTLITLITLITLPLPAALITPDILLVIDGNLDFSITYSILYALVYSHL